MPNQSGDYMLFFDSGGEGDFSLGPFQRRKVEYTLSRSITCGLPAYGKVQLRVNGSLVGEPVDLYRAFVDMFPREVWPPKEYVFEGCLILKPGMNVFNFSIADKNEEATGYRSGSIVSYWKKKRIR